MDLLSPSDIPDEDLLERLPAAGADLRNAFLRALIARYSERIGLFLMRLYPTLSKEDIEESVADTFLAVVDTVPYDRHKASVWTWLSRIALNFVRNRARSEKAVRRKQLISLDEYQKLMEELEIQDSPAVKAQYQEVLAFLREQRAHFTDPLDQDILQDLLTGGPDTVAGDTQLAGKHHSSTSHVAKRRYVIRGYLCERLEEKGLLSRIALERTNESHEQAG
jgi:DNA-directed RNA polymerase specialized sigma24 family protein